MNQQHFAVGEPVYFVGLDQRGTWAVFGTTVKTIIKKGKLWTYELAAWPFSIRRQETDIYRDYTQAKGVAAMYSQREIFPERGGRKISYKTIQKSETLRP